MKLAPQSREILRQYKALINARRRDAGQREMTTAYTTGRIRPVSMMAGVRAGGRLSAHAKTRAGCACRRETSPRLRRRALSSPLSVAVAQECDRI